MHTLEELQQIVMSHLCDKCRPLYGPLIEPTIIEMLSEFFFDWQGIEAETRFILEWSVGAFKKRPYLFDSDWGEDLTVLSDEIDVELYECVRRMSFGRQVSKLKERSVIGPELDSLLRYVARRRNRIHKYKVSIPEDDRTLFFAVHNLMKHFSHKLQNPITASDQEQLKIGAEENKQ